jgi:beta-RFAP synthase
MFSFGDRQVRQFGGVGAMIEQPALQLRITSASSFACQGELCERVEKMARRWASQRGIDILHCRIDAMLTPPQHTGLGVGTQLAMSVGAGLNTAFDTDPMTPVELATMMGRGLRSAVGTYGFFYGGLIVEEGKTPDEALAPLKTRRKLPQEWRFLLLRPRARFGIFGAAERKAFGELPAVSRATTHQLWRIVEMQMLPALEAGNLEHFGESVYEFNVLAGSCFASRQGGSFASEQLERWIKTIRDLGVSGVGQSSWGPTLFAIVSGQHAAEELAKEFHARHPNEDVEYTITPPANEGAAIVKS